MLAVAAFIIGILAIGAAVIAEDRTQRAVRAEKRAVEAQAIAEENATLAKQQLELLAVEQLLQQARNLKAQGNGKDAIAALEEAATRDPKMTDEIDKEITDVRRQVATRLVEAGEQLAAVGDHTTAFDSFEEALSLDPPPDTPIYVWIPAGGFIMGSNPTDDRAYPDQQPQHRVWVNGYWIQRTEVTNDNMGDVFDPTMRAAA